MISQSQSYSTLVATLLRRPNSIPGAAYSLHPMPLPLWLLIMNTGKTHIPPLLRNRVFDRILDCEIVRLSQMSGW
jgi:hypothetical protein